MRSGFVLIALLCVFTLIGAAMLMGDDTTLFAAPSAVRVGVESGRVSVKEGNEQVTLKAGEESTSRQEQRIAVAAAPEQAKPTNAVADLRKPDSAITLPLTIAQTRDIELTITDALGEPIPSGTVQAGSETIEFVDGKCRLPNMNREEMEVTIQAKGYQSRTQALTADETGRNIALEYLQTVDIRVVAQKESTVPVTGVEVRLWKGLEVRRPVGQTVRVPFLQMGKPSYGKIQRDHDRMAIVDIESSDPNAADAPSIGDRLVGMGYYSINPNEKLQFKINIDFLPLAQPQSILLRIWDTLSLLSERPTVQRFHGLNIEFERRGERKSLVLRRATRFQNGIEIEKSITNANGFCRFKNLTPGLYYAQAFQGMRHSAIFDIHPIQGGANLWLDEGSLGVSVERESGNLWQLNGIPNAQVLVKPLEDQGGIQAKTTDDNGYRFFQSLPYGKYEITVKPPEESGLQAQTRTIELVEPYQREYFTYEALPGCEFSGRVLQADTREPVAGYTVALRVQKILNSNKPGVYGLHDTQITDNDGSFHFTGVVPGEYSIDGPNLGNYKGYLTEGLCIIPGGLNWSTSGRIDISQSIRDFTLLVQPGVETHIGGKVIKPDGTLVPGAEIQLSRTVQYTRNGQIRESEQNYPLMGTYVADEKGQFDFYFITTPDNKIHKEEIYAQLVESFKSNKTQGMSGGGSGSYRSGGGTAAFSISSARGTYMADEKGTYYITSSSTSDPSSGPGNIRCRGQVPVEFRIGSTLLNVNVIVQDVVPYVVEGIVSTEDGKLPEFISTPGSGMGMMGSGFNQMPLMLSIGCYKDNQWYQGEIDPQGRYRIEFPSPGPVELQVSTGEGSREVDGWGTRNVEKYCAEFPKAGLSDANRTVQLDIVLQRGYYLYGRIVDQNNKPVVDAEVWGKAGDEKNPTSVGYCRSNSLGNFSVAGLKRNQPHTLTVKFSFSKEDIVTIPNLMPVEENSTQMIPIKISR